MTVKRALPWGMAMLLVALIALTCRVTFVPDRVPDPSENTGGSSAAAAPVSFVEQYALDNWETRVLPAIAERAMDLPQFLTAVQDDLDAAGAAHGNRANETSPWSFCVRGEGRVVGLKNADKPNSTTLLLDMAPCDGNADIQLHFGRVFSSNIKNAIRDGVGFLKLDDFTNQVEFAQLTNAFNNRVKQDVIFAHEAGDFIDKTVRFEGCVSLQDARPESLVIIPVRLDIPETAQ